MEWFEYLCWGTLVWQRHIGFCGHEHHFPGVPIGSVRECNVGQGMFADEPGVCLHWPLQNAGMLEKERSCSSTFTDLRRRLDCPLVKKGAQAECGHCPKRSRSSSISGSSVTSADSSGSLPPTQKHRAAGHIHIHRHTHTHEQEDGFKKNPIVFTRCFWPSIGSRYLSPGRSLQEMQKAWIPGLVRWAC